MTDFITECNPGFTGIECVLVCPYPLYGYDCQQICKCFKLNCDIASGCRNSMYDVTILCQLFQSL